jgi:carbon-monoxide dehydrogenase medium subunit
MHYYRRLPPFEYGAPKSLAEACTFLAAHAADTRISAGGTITLHRMKERIGLKKYLMSLKAIPGLDSIRAAQDGTLVIGPMASIQSVADAKPVQKHAPLLAAACSIHATPQIRAMGTIGGNVACNLATAETMPVLAALGAHVKLTSSTQTRTVPVEDLYRELKDTELLTGILLPAAQTAKTGYEKWAVRKRFDYATVSAAVALSLSGKKCTSARIALGGVTLPTRIPKKAEAQLQGQTITAALIEQVAEAASKEAHVGADVAFTAAYKKELVTVMVTRAITKALA